MRALLSILLPALAFALYGQTYGHGFIEMDDDLYLLVNPAVRSGWTWDGLRWAFTTFHVANWHPLAWISHMLDVQLFGMAPGPHHLVSASLHAVNTALLFVLLRQATSRVWPSAFVAALFAVHPLHVESVAWVAERKDVLSTLFFFLALLLYRLYARRPSLPRYAAVAAAFVLGLLSKPMVVTLPLVLLLWDFWPLGRLSLGQERTGPETGIDAVPPRRLLLEKVPLLCLSFLSSVVTVLAQRAGGATSTLDIVPFWVRAVNAVYAYGAYLWKTFVPVRLAAYYPHPWTADPPVLALPLWAVMLSFAVLALVTALCVRLWRRAPYLVTGWLFFLGTLVPVIGLVQVGAQGMADRYTYLPLTGVFLMAAFGIPQATGGRRIHPALLPVSAAAVLALFSALTFAQIRHWRSSVDLFRHAISVTRDNWYAHTNLGDALLHAKDLDGAILHYRETLRLRPGFSTTHNNLGYALLMKGDAEGAIPHLREALRGFPGNPVILQNLRMAEYRKGRNPATHPP